MLSLSERRTVALVGLGTWAVVGLPTLRALWAAPLSLSRSSALVWLGAFVLFGLALGGSGMAGERPGWGRLLLGVQSAAALAMTAVLPCYFSTVVFALVAWQAALVAPLGPALLGLGVQALGLAVLLTLHARDAWLGWASVGSHLGFQSLAFVTAWVAQREARSRHRLAAVVSELRATQRLLAEASRTAERTRISQELHDVLGHRLVALHLQLEGVAQAAGPLPPAPLPRAQALTRELLADLREVVRQVRGDARVDARRAAQACSEGIERPRIHLAWELDTPEADAPRAHALVRCIQEAVTNTLKHADAENLWLCVRPQGDAWLVEARDDGRGAPRFMPGWGLRGMRERLEQMGGRLEVASGPERGFALQAWIPAAGGTP